jgi:hypothetical protein
MSSRSRTTLQHASDTYPRDVVVDQRARVPDQFVFLSSDGDVNGHPMAVRKAVESDILHFPDQFQ